MTSSGTHVTTHATPKLQRSECHVFTKTEVTQLVLHKGPNPHVSANVPTAAHKVNMQTAAVIAAKFSEQKQHESWNAVQGIHIGDNNEIKMLQRVAEVGL